MASGSQTYKFQNTFGGIEGVKWTVSCYMSELISGSTSQLELWGLLAVIQNSWIIPKPIDLSNGR